VCVCVFITAGPRGRGVPLPNVVASHRFATVDLKPLLSVSESGVTFLGPNCVVKRRMEKIKCLYHTACD